LRIALGGVGTESVAQRLAEATRQHGVEIELLVVNAPGDVPPRCDHFMLIAGDDDGAWREMLSTSGQPFSVLHGDIAESALDVIASLQPRAGLLTRLQQRDAAQPAWRWVCEKCDSPECEHASMNDRRR
jgi:hypothetical protein